MPREPSPLVTVVEPGQTSEFDLEDESEEEVEEEEDPKELPLNSTDVEVFDELYDRNIEL